MGGGEGIYGFISCVPLFKFGLVTSLHYIEVHVSVSGGDRSLTSEAFEVLLDECGLILVLTVVMF
jgi:hypothetical protein